MSKSGPEWLALKDALDERRRSESALEVYGSAGADVALVLAVMRAGQRVQATAAAWGLTLGDQTDAEDIHQMMAFCPFEEDRVEILVECIALELELDSRWLPALQTAVLAAVDGVRAQVGAGTVPQESN